MTKEYVKEKEGIEALKDIVSVFEKNGIKYWLGRGLFRHYTLHQKLGDKLSDIDFHTWVDVRSLVEKTLDGLASQGYTYIIFHDYKASFKHPNGTTVEIVYLFKEGDKAYHQSKSRKLYCRSSYFNNQTMAMFGIKIRIPDEKYFPEIYGEEWKDEKEQ